MLSRRQLVTAGSAAGVLAAAVPAGQALGARRGRKPRGASNEPFSAPVTFPRPLRPARTGQYDVYNLTTKNSRASIVPGTRSEVRTFNGQLNPLIVAQRGRPVIINQTNQLDVPFSMHLHGGHVPAHSDGHPDNEVAPGGQRAFYYPNDQRASTMWIHDHSHDAHGENIYRGIAATYLLTDEFEENLPLPKGEYDVTLQLKDAKIEDDGTLVFDPHDFMGRTQYLVNNTPRPYFEVAARKYRIRLVNTSNERAFFLQLGQGEEMTQIASDGGLLPGPAPTRMLQLWPAERNEIVIDFSRYPVGTQLVLSNAVTFGDEDTGVMRFDVVRTADDPSSVPNTLRPAPDLGTPTVERHFLMSFDQQTGQHLINGKAFDAGRVDFQPTLGTTEVWTIENEASAFTIPHSMHPHLEHFRVLDRNGQPPELGETGLKDTITVLSGESARIAIRFTDYPGRFMYHCHLMGHLTMGMMGQFETRA